MAEQAHGSQAYIAIVPEVTYGVIPSTPELTKIPFLSFGLSPNYQFYDDEMSNGDRMLREPTRGNQDVKGTLSANLKARDFLPLLESVMQSTFVANVLKTGLTPKSFTLEQGFDDIGQYQVYTGVMVDKVSIHIPQAGLVTASFDLIGSGAEAPAVATIDTTPPITASFDERAFFHRNASGFIKEGGVAIAYMQDANIMIENNLSANYALGSDKIDNLASSYLKVSGDATFLFKNQDVLTKFINQTATSLDFKLHDGTHSLQFFLPTVTYTSHARDVGSTASVVAKFNFSSTYNAGQDSNLVITKS